MENILATLLGVLDTSPNIQSALTQIKSAIRLNRLNLIEAQNNLYQFECSIQKADRLLDSETLDSEDVLYWRHTKSSAQLSIELIKEQLVEMSSAEKTLYSLNEKYSLLCDTTVDANTQLQNLLDQKLESLLPKQVQVKNDH